MVSQIFSQSNPFKALEKRGLRSDIEDAFTIECAQNGLPQTEANKNAYLLLCQNIIEHYDAPISSLDVSTVIQQHALEPAYAIQQHGKEQMEHFAKSRRSAEFTPLPDITDAMITAPIVHSALSYTGDKTPFIQCGLQDELKYSSACNFTIGKHGQAYGKAYQSDADTVFLAIFRKQTNLLSTELNQHIHDQKLSTNIQIAVALAYQTYENLGLSGATTLERDIIEGQESLLSRAYTTLKNHNAQIKAAPSGDSNIIQLPNSSLD